MSVGVQIENFGEQNSVRYQFINGKHKYAVSHIHQFMELVVVFEGDIDITVDNRTETIHPGEAALIFPYQSHNYTSEVNNKLSVFVFSFAMIPEFYNATEGMVGKQSVFSLSETAMNNFKERIVDVSEFSVYDFKGCAYFALSDFLNQVELCQASYKNNFPVRIINYIKEHISEEIKISSVAAEVGYSSKYLSNCIKKVFGMNFAMLVANIRVDIAKRLLRETDKTITQICYECGFGSECTFYRRFRGVMNVTPNEYRASLLNRKIDQGVLYTFENNTENKNGFDL